MSVVVRFFAFIRDEAGVDQCRLLLESGSCVQDARERLKADFPRIAQWLDSCRPAVNLEYAGWDAMLHEGDELCLIPPVSGG